MQGSDRPNASETTPMTRGRKPPARGVRAVAVMGLAATAVVVALVARHGALTSSSGAAESNIADPDSGVTSAGRPKLFPSLRPRVAPRPSLGQEGEASVSSEETDVENPGARPGGASEPRVWTYAIKNVYPHDPTAFTQGLVFQSPDTLLESTGSVGGPSTVRRVDLQTGAVLRRENLEKSVFAEGLTMLPPGAFVDGSAGSGDSTRNVLAQIAWKKNAGFLYDAETLERLGAFATPLSDGWGLTTDPDDASALIVTDASDALTFVEIGEAGAEWREIKKVTVRDGERKIRFANELETVRGEVWGNVIETECIVRVDPKTGNVLGWIDLTGIKKKIEPAPRRGDVMNGIAYDEAGDRVFVTGKKWSALFEVTVVPSDASLEETRERCWPAETLPQYGYP
jgi:glutamine cyclotransferase